MSTFGDAAYEDYSRDEYREYMRRKANGSTPGIRLTHSRQSTWLRAISPI